MFRISFLIGIMFAVAVMLSGLGEESPFLATRGENTEEKVEMNYAKHLPFEDDDYLPFEVDDDRLPFEDDDYYWMEEAAEKREELSGNGNDNEDTYDQDDDDDDEQPDKEGPNLRGENSNGNNDKTSQNTKHNKHKHKHPKNQNNENEKSNNNDNNSGNGDNDNNNDNNSSGNGNKNKSGPYPQPGPHVDFDPSLTLEDYTKKGHDYLPTDKWMQQCDAALQKDPEVFRPFQNDKGKTHIKDKHLYRLGDCVRLCSSCSGGNHGHPSFATSYRELACDEFKDHQELRKNNLDVMEEIFHMFEHNSVYDLEKPDPEAVMIHLRLGDVVEKGYTFTNKGSSASEFLMNGGKAAHPGYHHAKRKHQKFDPMTIYPIKEYYRAIKGAGAKKVIINGGSHKPDEFEISKVYANCLARGLAYAGLDVEFRVDRDDHADVDFYYMTHSKKFILSSGGFSRVIGAMVVHLGGEVIESGRLAELNNGFA